MMIKKKNRGAPRRASFLLLVLWLLRTSAAAEAEAQFQARHVAKLEGAAASVVAFSENGDRLVLAGGFDVRIWDARSFVPVSPNLRHESDVRAAALGPKGDVALTANGRAARLWDVTRGKLIHVLEHGEDVRSASFRHTGDRALVAGGRAGRIWDVRTGQQLVSYRHPGDVLYAEFATRGDNVLSVVRPVPKDEASRVEDQNPTLPSYIKVAAAMVWDGRTGGVLKEPKVVSVFPYHIGELAVRPAALSPDGAKLVTINSHSIRIWDTHRDEPPRFLWTWDDTRTPNYGPASWVAFGSSGTTFVACGSRYARVMTCDIGKGEPAMVGSEFGWRTARLSARGDFVLLTSALGAFAVVERSTGTRILHRENPVGDDGPPPSLPVGAFSPDDRFVVVSSPDGGADVWELTGEVPVK